MFFVTLFCKREKKRKIYLGFRIVRLGVEERVEIARGDDRVFGVSFLIFVNIGLFFRILGEREGVIFR